MQMVKKGLLALIIFWIAFLIMMPKEALYFKLEHRLEKEGIKLNEASIEEHMFGLDIHQVKVYAEGIQVVQIKRIHLFTLLFYTLLEVDEVKVDKGLQEMAPKYIHTIRVKHSILMPLKILIAGTGSFGEAQGEVALKEQKVHIDILKAKEIQPIQSFLKRNKKGWYYETSF